MSKGEKDKSEMKQDDKSLVKYQGWRGQCIGSGVSGSVYSLVGKDGANLLINKKEWVVKWPLSETEEKITAQYRDTFSKNGRYLITEKVNGVHLDRVRFGFLVALEVASFIAQILNRYHHYTLTSDVTVHNDLHPGNILVDIDREKKKIKDINIIDFSYSLDINSDDPDILHPDWNSLPFIETRPHAAWENRSRPIPFFPAYAGIKSDIYQLGKLFDNNLLFFYDYPTIEGIDIKKLLSEFRDMMGNQEHQKRPNSDETLLFFNTLYRIYKIHAKDTNNNTDIKIVLIAKLILLSNGQWNEKISMEAKSHVEMDKTWNSFDFENEVNMPACRAILNISKYTLLNGNIENIIVNNVDISTKIASSASKNEIIKHLADKFGLNFLCHIKGNIEQRREISKVAILHLLDRSKNKTDVKEIIEKLESLAKENKIDFIYKRQGYFTFSYHNHKWKGEKVSATWLEIMALAKKRENAVPEEKVYLRSRL